MWRHLLSPSAKGVNRHWRLRLDRLEGRTVPSTFTVNALTDTGAGAGTMGDLRYCVSQANATPGTDNILFDAAVFSGSTQTISLANGELALSEAVTITEIGRAHV